jgi:hypothetical protein
LRIAYETAEVLIENDKGIRKNIICDYQDISLFHTGDEVKLSAEIAVSDRLGRWIVNRRTGFKSPVAYFRINAKSSVT